MSAYQGLRPWLRSCALRAEQKLFIVYQGLRPWQHSSAFGREHMLFNVRLPGTSSLATFARPPGGRIIGDSHSPDLWVNPGRTARPVAVPHLSASPMLGMRCLRPPSGREQESFDVRLPGTSSLATFARPPGGKRTATWRHSPRLSPSARRADETYLKTTF